MKEEGFVIYDHCKIRTGGKRHRRKWYQAVLKNIKVLVMIIVKNEFFFYSQVPNNCANKICLSVFN